MKILNILLLDTHGTGSEYIWEELEKISDISCEDTKEDLIYNFPDMTEDKNYNVIGKKFNWTKLYGELSSGEYEFVLSSSENLICIRIKFTINENGEILINNPELM